MFPVQVVLAQGLGCGDTFGRRLEDVDVAVFSRESRYFPRYSPKVLATYIPISHTWYIYNRMNTKFLNLEARSI